MTQRIAVIGLGAMGRPMAERLLESGVDVSVVAGHAADAVECLEREGATVRASPAQAASSADVVITSLPDASALSDVLLDGADPVIASTGRPLVVDTSTIGPRAAHELAGRLAAHGIRYVDCPVSGGPAGAAAGRLTAFVGASVDDLAAVEPVLSALARQVWHVGEPAAGQAVKLCNNLLVGSMMLANVEAVLLGRAHGIPAADLVAMLASGSAANWQLDNVLPRTVLADDFTPIFPAVHMLKDLELALDAAAAAGLALDGAEVAAGSYRRLCDELDGRQDFSAVVGLDRGVVAAAVGGGPR